MSSNFVNENGIRPHSRLTGIKIFERSAACLPAEGHEFHIILRLYRYHNDEISLAFVTLRTVEYRSALCSYKIKAIVRDNV